MNRWPDDASTGPDEHSPVAELARALIDAICDTIAGWLHPIMGAATVPLLLITPLLIIGIAWLAATRVARNRTHSDRM
ncbi:hypothetical protein ACQP1G_16050 [Nocardia sp. CA-107356]|uniref:hypothetical protein n=1 Tax=Nocardia sp. CA-107356 TaxID=3239972 RepID=UPI003D8FFC2F